MRRCAVALIAAVGTALTPPLRAQQPHSLTLDATVGGGYGRGGGERVGRNFLSADVALASRVRTASRGSLLVAMTGAWHGNLGDAGCLLAADRRSCVPKYPSLTSAGALVGWEIRQGSSARGASARVAAGPAYYHGDGGHALGLQARFDLATPAPFHVALVASARGVVLPNFRGDALAVGTLGFGVRLQ
jgi:hypothetical protein